MNKKIKVIDVFNIISKGDFVSLPLNIEVDGKKYNWDNLEHFYRRKDENEDLLELATVYDTVTLLDMNVEILDETEEIEEIKETNFEEIGYEIGKLYLDFAKGIERAVKQMRKEMEKQ